MGQYALQSIVSFLSGLMMLAALFLLWWKSKSPWLLGAFVAEGAGFAFHLVLVVVPSIMNTLPFLGIVWTVCYFAMAGCLLAYALTETMQQGNSQP
jgi:SNF family Na+-dependent transporter